MQIAIIKYNAGNTFSVQSALKRLGVESIVTDDYEQILSAEKVIFPGVGEASTAMQYLKERKLDQTIKELKQPFLGICLGLQLMCEHSEEGNTDCLGIFPVQVKKFPSGKVPQIGWNIIDNYNSNLFQGLEKKSYVYFVHSYYAELTPYSAATTDYSLEYSSALQKDNYHAVQFHPEKSADIGAKILSNFLDLN